MTDDIFDLDAIAAEEGEKPFVFRFDGEEYVCAADVSIEVIKAIEAEDILGAAELILGAEQWTRLQQSKKVFGAKAMGRMFDAYTKHLGLDVPNLSGSTASSAITRKR